MAGRSDRNAEWSVYGGNLAGQHHSPLRQINSATVHNLQVAWRFHTGALTKPGSATQRGSFEANPVFWNGRLFFDTPFDEIFALDAATGAKLWSFDPKIDREIKVPGVTSRGVALWHSIDPGKGSCASQRVFVATLDRRLIGVDADTGNPCKNFGQDGTVDLGAGLTLRNAAWYSFTSPPTIVGNVVIIGSASADNQAIDAPGGAIRAFDAISGKLLWSWEPIPWAKHTQPPTGSGGAWSAISADPQHGLIFVPTGSPSLDFYGGQRAGDNRDANSVVALEVLTGKRVWGFQVVHHDLWDYDVAAEPLLFTFRGKIPAVAITTKMGMIFVLNRLTGEPLYPVYEKPVPQSDIPGEKTSATQPFSSLPPLAAFTFSAGDIVGKTDADQKFCREKIAGLVNKGIYTPIGLKPTLLYPGDIGGVNWGSAAFDPATGVLYVNTNRLAYDIRLIPRDNPFDTLLRLLEVRAEKNKTTGEPGFRPAIGGKELDPQAGSPYLLFREIILSPSGLPCNPPPWGELVAFNLNTGKKEWSRALGTMIPGRETGSINLGGPISVADVIISAATVEPVIRAYSKEDGHELWKADLTVPAQSTPMTYMAGKKQYLVICAGGHGLIGTPRGDEVVAFAIP